MGKTQTEFWELVGVTQSAGSRYETGRDIPLPVRCIVAIVFKRQFKEHLGVA